MRHLFAAALLVLMPRVETARAETGSAGAETLNLLYMGGTSRPTALGGAYTALASDSNALFYNPGGLGRIRRHEAAFMHNQSFQGLTQDVAAWSSPWGVGLGLNIVRVGSIPRTTIRSQDETLGSFAMTSLAASAGYGRTLPGGLAVGGALKLLHEEIDKVSADGVAADAGVLWAVPGAAGLRLGAAVQNIGPRISFSDQKERLPLLFRGGAAYGFSIREYEMTLAADMLKDRHGKARVGLGAETVFMRRLALRAGWSNRSDADYGVTAGIGWRVKAMSFDYAAVPFGELGFTHRFTASVRWGPESSPDQAEPAGPRLGKVRPWTKPSTGLEPPDPELAVLGEEKRDARQERKREEIERATQRVQDLEREGSIHFLTSEVAKAKAAYLDAISLARSAGLTGTVVADAYAGLGDCLAAEGKTALALKAYDKAIEYVPSPEARPAIEEKIRELKKRR